MKFNLNENKFKCFAIPKENTIGFTEFKLDFLNFFYIAIYIFPECGKRYNERNPDTIQSTGFETNTREVSVFECG